MPGLLAVKTPPHEANSLPSPNLLIDAFKSPMCNYTKSCDISFAPHSSRKTIHVVIFYIYNNDLYRLAKTKL